MASWRDIILKQFTKGVARLTIVSDPDGLLTEERMVAAIQERGFEIIPHDDPIAFRYAYESKYRSLWDQGQNTELVVVLRAEQDASRLPYDLLCAGRLLSFALHRLFPKLAYPVIESLDRSYLDDLYDAYQQHDGAELGEQATKGFVLMHCFGVVPKLIRTPVDLLKHLLSRHYRGAMIPESLDVFLLESLRNDHCFDDWPLERILSSRDGFLRLLQEEWPKYLDSLENPSRKCLLPFGHEDVRVYIDNLFLEGLLTPVQQERIEHLPKWVLTGVTHDPQVNSLQRMQRLVEHFQQEIPAADASHRDWQRAASTWAELVVLRWEVDATLDAKDRESWQALQESVENRFADWMLSRFGSLHNLPFQPQPVMVHHVPHYLAAQRNQGKLGKIALVIVDGLALDQWNLVRRSLMAQHPNWRLEETNLFAWVPTLTSVSRQAIFAAEPPLYFPDSFDRTDKEESLWCRFWENQGLNRSEVDCVKGVESGQSAELDASLANPRLSVLGVVVNKVDEIMHGMQLGVAGMHGQVSLWSAQGSFASLMSRLHHEGFAVFLTADHGNVSAEGIGSPQEGVLVEIAGKRARVYEQPSFRDQAKSTCPAAIEWPGVGLPPHRHVLLAPGLRAFAVEGQRLVSHGGIALEEVMVPFVRINVDAI
jgi:hypothetical protein